MHVRIHGACRERPSHHVVYDLCAVLLAAAAPLGRGLSGNAALVVIGVVASLGAFALRELVAAGGFGIGLVIAVVQPAIVSPGGHVRYEFAERVDVTAVPIPLLGYLLLACREELAFH